ncbi:MAG: exodeoxyribonuclease VII small subunit [Pyramidobacter sp.]|jgi:exodeoxyribonuclease VII small subunit
MNYSEKIEQLEKILKEMESGAMPLEKTLALYEEGQKLIKQCRDYLAQAEGKISKLGDDGTLSDFGGTSDAEKQDRGADADEF